MNTNFKTDIDSVNQIFENVLSNYKSNYVNFHTNATLSLPSASLIPPTSDAAKEDTTTMDTKKPRPIKDQKDQKDPNDEALLKYRYAANNLLEKVRSQISSNSKQISAINANITPIQKQYLQVMETGTELHQTKMAAVSSLEDYNELYKTTVFGTLMYVAGSAFILYLMYKPKTQSQY
jgi:hypothetical protein